MTARPSHRLAVTLSVTAAVFLLSSCTEPGPALGPLLPPASTAPSSATPGTPSSSASPSAAAPTTAELPSAEKQALAEATGAVTDYYVAVDSINSDPSSDLDTLEDVASGDAYLTSVRLVDDMKGRGLVQTGDLRVVDVDVVSIDLTRSPPSRYPTVVLDACLDVSATYVEDPDGKSAVLPDRLDRITARLDVVHHDFGWRVHDIASAGEPCAP